MAKQTDPRVLARSPCHLLKRASQYAAAVYMETVGRTGLTQRQFAVLLAAEKHEGASQTELVQVTGIDRSTLADMVSRLMAQGYLQARRGREDGRTNAVRLTAAGRRALRAAEPGAGEADKLLLAAVPPKLRKSFIEGLMSLAAKLEDGESPPPTLAKPRKGGAAGGRGRGAKSAAP